MTTAALSLSGDLDIYRKPELQAKIYPLEDCDVAVLDLSSVRYLDAATIGCFVALRARMLARGRLGRVVIQAAPRHIVRLLEICGLDGVFEIERRHPKSSNIKSERAWNGMQSMDHGCAVNE